MEFINDISKMPLSKVVMLHIKNAILTWQLEYQEKIPPEREMASGFNVSRNIVREAIRALEMAGYLEIRQGPKGGAFVRELSPDRLSGGFLDFYLAEKLTIEELNNVRLYIEPEVARLAAKNINPENARLLQKTVDNEHMADAIDDRVKSMTKFHLVLAKMSGNFFYEIIVNVLVSIKKEIVVAGHREGDPIVHGTGQHTKIINAILEGKPDEAAEAMREHLIKYSARLVELEKKYRERIKL